ncbi:HAD-IIA family hydrolase [Spirochaeta isovalerica]|uniref:HAD superfamily hydrolase (TIGR01450 family) n=1 Tax=Spirochaeta isovalerica TaxID=150 RepID=A0A841R7M3_9SPIO|nr:HAD hydrolase-like protein [Spirochaeta isovalerica]MBB6481264.1 HAD superfamily hydrolase (TIGR01450 family) [Spirochaeta isovalerica]
MKKLLIDLDGTILEGPAPINDAREFFEKAEKLEIDFLIMTNSVKSPLLIKKRLSDAGLAVPMPSIINPIIAINSYLRRKGFGTAYIVGSGQEMEQVCIPHNEEYPEIVLLLDFEKENLSYSDLQNIFLFQQKGVPLITASASPYYLSGERKQLDTGAFVSLFETAGNTKIEVFGKPSLSYYTEALEILDAPPEDVIVIGDDWKTDIQGAENSGCHAFLARSGKYQPGDESHVPGIGVIDSLMEVFQYLD